MKRYIFSCIVLISTTSLFCMEQLAQRVPRDQTIIQIHVHEQLHNEQAIQINAPISSRPLYYQQESTLSTCGMSGYIIGKDPVKKMFSIFVGSVSVIVIIVFVASRL